MQIPEPSQEAISILQQAMEILDETSETGRNAEQMYNIASLCALAIKKANAPFPRAHSLLAFSLLALEKNKEALEHANVALKLNPLEFQAQAVITYYAFMNVRVTKLGVRNFIRGGGGGGDWATELVGGILASTVSTIFSIGSAGHSKYTQQTCKNELLKLVEIYKTICQDRVDENDYIKMAESLMSFADLIKEMPGSKPNLYSEIINIPLSHISIIEKEKEVIKLRQLAEGKAMLFI